MVNNGCKLKKYNTTLKQKKCESCFSSNFKKRILPVSKAEVLNPWEKQAGL